MVDALKEELDALDQKIEFLINIKVAMALTGCDKKKALPEPESKSTASTAPTSSDSEETLENDTANCVANFKHRAVQA